MSKIKPGLGRGLDALINPSTQEELSKPVEVISPDLQKDDGSSNEILVTLPTENIYPNPYQPRVDFDSKTLDELKHSILKNGLIQPITVRRAGEGRYELISGERRLKACKEIGYKTIPAYIFQVDTKEAMLALALIENIQRDKLNAIEIANAYKRLIDECNLSQEDVSEKVGKDRSTITNSLRLLKLPEQIQHSLIKDEITAGHARALINLYDENLQLHILEKIKKNSLSVRKVEELVRKIGETKKTGGTRKKETISDQDLISQKEIEDKLRIVFGTKVTCRQRKDGAGQITIDFYSNDELDRLFELFDLIEKSN
ncbi:MAG: ParB/RepB/Spo0J family partition protein [Melioribacteraceae bacterium]|nr:ParB/RepB/Spo0J family partition protein [Melioribacteraceae bacterium]